MYIVFLVININSVSLIFIEFLGGKITKNIY